MTKSFREPQDYQKYLEVVPAAWSRINTTMTQTTGYGR
jgi:hypothetical protein